MSGKDKWVRRFSVDETARHKNGFTIYKITSVVIEERAKAIKRVLEFIAEHRLLFTSMEFDHFMQDTPPLEYQTDDDDRTPHHTPTANVERPPLSPAMSLESVEDLNDALYDEISKITIEKRSAVKKKQTLPDLIIFDEPSCSNFEDYHNMPRTSDATSLTSTKHKTAIVARELSRYNIDVAALSETHLADEGELVEQGGGYTFFWKGLASSEPRSYKRNVQTSRQALKHVDASKVQTRI
ncbi:hypothetical protein MSG28_012886 [Choristoneura fumiferana]|uniref:Uncharacterized protein n=1 Tax=Choristoneura fumiferana TaxID=7141 RepID=A0ACC0JIE1_CHOFU|nr:hypothetical protein MSG28_012886 [Choristoneura fumiferana]